MAYLYSLSFWLLHIFSDVDALNILPRMLTEEQSTALSFGNVNPAEPDIIQTTFPTGPLVRKIF